MSFTNEQEFELAELLGKLDYHSRQVHDLIQKIISIHDEKDSADIREIIAELENKIANEKNNEM